MIFHMCFVFVLFIYDLTGTGIGVSLTVMILSIFSFIISLFNGYRGLVLQPF